MPIHEKISLRAYTVNLGILSQDQSYPQSTGYKIVHVENFATLLTQIVRSAVNATYN